MKLLSFPRSAWERNALTLCVAILDAERLLSPFPRGALERESNSSFFIAFHSSFFIAFHISVLRASITLTLTRVPKKYYRLIRGRLKGGLTRFWKQVDSGKAKVYGSGGKSLLTGLTYPTCLKAFCFESLPLVTPLTLSYYALYQNIRGAHRDKTD